MARGGAGTIMLLGPGRWGTSSPSLGIPVSFVDINRVSVLCEIVAMREDLVPDVSLGTHFLSELVEMDMLYLALFPKQGVFRFQVLASIRILVNLVGSASQSRKAWAVLSKGYISVIKSAKGC